MPSRFFIFRQVEKLIYNLLSRISILEIDQVIIEYFAIKISGYATFIKNKSPPLFSTCSFLRFHSPLFVLICIMVSHDAHLKNRLVKTVSSNSTPQIAQYLTRASPLGVTSSTSLDMILLLYFFFIYFIICTQKAIIQSCKTNQIVLIIKK